MLPTYDLCNLQLINFTTKTANGMSSQLATIASRLAVQTLSSWAYDSFSTAEDCREDVLMIKDEVESVDAFWGEAQE